MSGAAIERTSEDVAQTRAFLGRVRFIIEEGGTRAIGDQLYHVRDRALGAYIDQDGNATENDGLGMYYGQAKRLRDRRRQEEGIK